MVSHFGLLYGDVFAYFVLGFLAFIRGKSNALQKYHRLLAKRTLATDSRSLACKQIVSVLRFAQQGRHDDAYEILVYVFMQPKAISGWLGRWEWLADFKASDCLTWRRPLCRIRSKCEKAKCERNHAKRTQSL